MKVTYLYNSGFLVELENHILLFDYYQGTIPDLNPSKPLYVFVSHSHYDHYNPTIYNLNHPNITYIIDHEINNKGIKVLPNKHYYVDDLNIHTLLSSDEGVAFIIEIGNKRIYHAGDLHWWHWIGEPDSDNNYQANTFKSEINKIKDLNFDLMMIPLDPRLEDSMHWELICNLMHETILFQRADFGYLNKLSTIVRTYSKTYLYILLDSDALFVPVLQVC